MTLATTCSSQFDWPTAIALMVMAVAWFAFLAWCVWLSTRD